jgi:hypothetical protein
MYRYQAAFKLKFDYSATGSGISYSLRHILVLVVKEYRAGTFVLVKLRILLFCDTGPFSETQAGTRCD